MGGVTKKIKKVVKKVVKPITKVVKKVVKGIGKVAKKVWKGVKGAVKKIGKTIKKLGPLASIAVGFIPGLQGLWANAGIWGAMGKGAITGFITSGGELKGALTGGLLGGAGYAVSQGASAFKGAWEGMGESASISDKITAGFKAVGETTSQGVTNMYNSASKFMTTGDIKDFNYLTDTGKSIYTPEGQAELATSDIPEDTFVRTPAGERAVGKTMQDKLKNIDIDSTLNQEALMGDYASRPTDWTQMSPNQQLRLHNAAIQGKIPAMDMAQEMGWTREAGLDYFEQAANPTSVMKEVGDYMAHTNTGLTQGSQLWQQTGGQDIAHSFDYGIDLNTGKSVYTGDGLEWTRQSGFGGTPAYISDPQRLAEVSKKKTPNVADALSKGLLSPSTGSAGLPFSTEDVGDEYEAVGGLEAVGGQAGTGLGFAESYGGALDPRHYTEQQAQKFKYLLG